MSNDKLSFICPVVASIIYINLPVIHEYVGLPDHGRWNTNALNTAEVWRIPCQIVVVPLLQGKQHLAVMADIKTSKGSQKSFGWNNVKSNFHFHLSASFLDQRKISSDIHVSDQVTKSIR